MSIWSTKTDQARRPEPTTAGPATAEPAATGPAPVGPPVPAPRPPIGPLGGARELAACAQTLAGALECGDEASMTVLAALPHLVYWKDREGRYRGGNRAFRAARSLPSDSDLAGCTETDLPVHDAFTTTLPALERNVLDAGVPATGVQSLTRPGTTGEGAKILLTIVPLRDPDGSLAGVVGVGADVTGLSDLDTKVSHAAKLESIGRLAANIAHQINTPVQFITDNVRFVADNVGAALHALQATRTALRNADGTDQTRVSHALGVLDQADIDFLDDELPSALLQSLEGLSQIAQIVTGLTDFSRSEGDITAADLNHAVDNAVNLALTEWTAVGDLRLDLDPTVGQIPCYEGELRQVLLNLISNAAQAIAARRDSDPDAPAGLIEVTTRHHGDTAQITVTDNGCGMDPATRARIFDPFFTTKPLGQATGQGLSLAYATIVGRHQGNIDVDTTPGQGSTFTLTLPTHQHQPPQDSPTPRA
jgi:two-component system NtrC family sensor kinase